MFCYLSHGFSERILCPFRETPLLKFPSHEGKMNKTRQQMDMSQWCRKNKLRHKKARSGKGSPGCTQACT